MGRMEPLEFRGDGLGPHSLLRACAESRGTSDLQVSHLSSEAKLSSDTYYVFMKPLKQPHTFPHLHAISVI